MDENWMKESWQFQQEIFGMFKNCGSYECGKNNFIRRMEYAWKTCFGDVGFNHNQKFKEYKEKMLKFFDEKRCVAVSLTFVNMRLINENHSGIICVICLCDSSGREWYYDMDNRNYKSWNEFLEENVLPKSYLIFPNSGKYFGRDVFVNLVCVESNACSPLKTVKMVCDVASFVGGVVGAGILIANPVSLPLLIAGGSAAVVSGIYTAGNSVTKLVDVHDHQGGLDITEAKTLLPVIEMVTSIGGSVAVGLSVGAKAMSSAETLTQKIWSLFVSEGTSFLSTMGNNVKLIGAISFGNLSVDFMIIFDKLINHKDIKLEDFNNLKEKLFLTYNVEIAIELLVEFFKKFFRDRENLVDVLMTNCNTYTEVKPFQRIESLASLRKIFLPDLSPIYNRITLNDIHSVLQNGFSILKSGKEDDLSKLHYVRKMMTSSFHHLNDKNKLLKSKIRDTFRHDLISSQVEKLIQEFDFGFGELNSVECEKTINSVFEIKSHIDNVLRKCNMFWKLGESDITFIEREKRLYDKLFSVLKLGKLKSTLYNVSFINFLAIQFLAVFIKEMELYNFDRFKTNCTVNTYTSLVSNKLFVASLNDLDRNFEECKTEFDTQNKNNETKSDYGSFYVSLLLNIPSGKKSLMKDWFLEKAAKLIMKLEGNYEYALINITNSSIECFERMDSCVVKMSGVHRTTKRANTYYVNFYVVEEGFKGLVMVMKNFELI